MIACIHSVFIQVKYIIYSKNNFLNLFMRMFSNMYSFFFVLIWGWNNISDTIEKLRQSRANIRLHSLFVFKLHLFPASLLAQLIKNDNMLFQMYHLSVCIITVLYSSDKEEVMFIRLKKCKGRSGQQTCFLAISCQIQSNFYICAYHNFLEKLQKHSVLNVEESSQE